jgi:hypothetical protein
MKMKLLVCLSLALAINTSLAGELKRIPLAFSFSGNVTAQGASVTNGDVVTILPAIKQTVTSVELLQWSGAAEKGGVKLVYWYYPDAPAENYFAALNSMGIEVTNLSSVMGFVAPGGNYGVLEGGKYTKTGMLLNYSQAETVSFSFQIPSCKFYVHGFYTSVEATKTLTTTYTHSFKGSMKSGSGSWVTILPSYKPGLIAAKFTISGSATFAN